MKRVVMALVGCVSVWSVVGVASAVTPTGRSDRVAIQQQNVMATGRMPSVPITAIGVTTSVSNIIEKPVTIATDTPKPEPVPEKDMREKEREACIRNNIGVGNTFVWASRYSDINNYSTMIEDTENPENNVCFVRVDVRSVDNRIDLSDIPGKYFEMGRNITCGSWVDEDMLEKRILDAKKNTRTWATVGGAVGGAALGVGSMELFGNKLIGGVVEGQKAGTVKDQFRAYLKSLGDAERRSWADFFTKMDQFCNIDWKAEYGAKPDGCDGFELADNNGNITMLSFEEMKNILK